MKSEDFSAWLSAISGMSEGERAEAMAALEKANAVAARAEAGASAKKAGNQNRREDALGTTSAERKKEKWLDCARAMIEGRSLAKTAQLCGVHPTTAFAGAIAFSAPAQATNPEA